MSRRNLVAQTILLVFCSIVFTITAHAQYNAGLQGAVLDESGAVIPGATVTLTSKDTNISLKATTEASGVYTFSRLAPGLYSLAAEKEGFKKKVYSDVPVVGERTNAFNAQLELGQVTESVTVTGAAPAIDTETAQLAGTITSKDIHSLPSFGRDPYQLLRLAPGVFGDGARNGSGDSADLPGNAGPGASGGTSGIYAVENRAQISANGTRSTSNGFQLDGVEINSVAWGGAAVVTPNEESVKEVQVVANNYTAENGRTSGAQVLVVSQSGTNTIHGSAFFKADRPGLNAFNRWNGPNFAPTVKDTNRFNQYGGSVGGPIKHDKLFGFFSYETLRNDSISTSTGWYETKQFLSIAPAGSIASTLLSFPGEGVSTNQFITKSCADAGISNPALCQQVPGGLDIGSPLTTPLGTADPGFVDPGHFGVGNGLDGIPDIQFVQTASPNLATNSQYNGRVDYQATSKDLIFFNLYITPVRTTFFNGPARAANLFHHKSIAHSEGAFWDHTLSPTMINEARVGISGWYWNELKSNPQLPFGLPSASVDGFGGVMSLNSFGGVGGSVFDQRTINIRDTLTKVYNSHSLKFGGEIYIEKFLDDAPWAAIPSYNFRNLWDFVNDAPYHEFSFFNATTGRPTDFAKNIRSRIEAFYVQDDYKLRPNLTLNLGLRWEYFGPLHETKGNISNVVFGPLPDPLTNLRVKVGGSLFSTSKNNWGPQLGFAWSPGSVLGRDFNSHLVIRGGVGIGYTRTEEAITLNTRFNPPLEDQFDLFGSNILYAVSSDLHSVTGYPSNPAAIETFDPTTGLPVGGAPVSLTAIPRNLPTPVTYRYSLEGQYEFGRDWVATIGYQGSQSRHYTRQNFLNWLYAPLNPRVQQVDFYPNDANASYNALLTEVQHRFSHTFQVDAQYTFSRTTDEGSHSFYVDQYPFNIIFSRGPADFDVTHNFKLYGIWNPRIFKGNGWKEKVVDGWQLSGVFNAHSGFPWTPIYGNTAGNIIYQGSGCCTLRPAAYLGGANSNYSNSTFQSDTGNFPKGALAYFTVPTFQPGPAFPASGPIPPPPGVGRNSFRGPRYLGDDVSLSKFFGFPTTRILGEGARFELRADFFNIFNKLNLDPTSISNAISFDGLTSNTHFGQTQGALVGRVIEIQGRFSF